MHTRATWIGLALGTALVLPAPGTESRSRDFCQQWLGLVAGEKHDVIVEAERREVAPGADGRCRAALRASLRHKVDAECRNWKLLMDFEVRAVVDGVLEACAPGSD